MSADNQRDERRELDEAERDYLDEQRMDAFIATLTPVREYLLPMADHE